MNTKIRRPFDPSSRVSIENTEPTLTKQCFREECDINNILKKYNRQMSGNFFETNAGYFNGLFDDVSAVPDYQSALHQMSEARGVFEAMPSNVRRRFNNDPAEMLDFLSNSANRDEASSLGFLVPPPPASPPPATPDRG